MPSSTNRSKFSTQELAIFAVLAAMMLISRIGLQGIKNIHPLGMMIAAMTLTYRWRALVPLYVYVLLDMLFSGFAFWIMPYLYIWLPLWGMFMLAGKVKLPDYAKAPVYMILCGLHGLAFGVLYAPFHALWAGLSWNGMIAWIVFGFPSDIIHAIGNFAAGSLIIPLALLLKRLDETRL
ncbi:MAG: hypothetical protein FWE06_10045 [Oscillospiraceae bacterium]|nr:hypothetical protein [Oscillospiraceae bacterium]